MLLINILEAGRMHMLQCPSFFSILFCISEKWAKKEDQKIREESTSMYLFSCVVNFVFILMRCVLSAENVRVFKVQNATVYKISWKGVEKEELDEDILKWIKIMLELYG